MNNTENERNYLGNIFNLKETQVMSLGSELEFQAARQPENSVLFWGDKKISYDEFNQLANKYANFFYLQGFRKGDVVALLMENRPEFLIAASGLSKLGVIISLINNGVRGEVLAHALNICDAKALILGHELLEAFLPIQNQVTLQAPATIYVETENLSIDLPSDLIQLNPLLDKASEQNPSTTNEITSDDVVVYIYTSGTTGFPKATAVTQKRWLVLGNLFSFYGEMGPDKVQYMVLPLYHNSGFDIGFSSTIVSGGTMALRKRFSTRAFWNDVRKYDASFFIYVGELCRYIYNQPEQANDTDNPLIFVAGNGMRGDLMEPFRKRFNIPHIKEVYGATEGVGSFLNMDEIPGMCGSLSLAGMRQGEIIKYDFENDVILRDENNYALKCEPGETGLLVCEINELNGFAGYVNNPEATESKMLRNLLQDGDEYFDSGDLVQLHENDYFSFVDRLGDTFRWKSENVSTNQVSDVVIKSGGLEDANVYGVRVPGMEGRCGMVALKPLDGVNIDLDDLAKYVKDKLPAFAIPYFVRIREQIDATNSFKQVKQQLQKEGFDPSVIKDPLYFLDPRANTYVPLTPEIYQDIAEHKVQF
ncbi:MAG TPA: long-chain-acyl-CoA synthetase [Syntrophomonadaceae bacterium]|nr:long-chain-acyl-CoA synthetase [Syntrophomonadaceae bacterium]